MYDVDPDVNWLIMSRDYDVTTQHAYRKVVFKGDTAVVQLVLDLYTGEVIHGYNYVCVEERDGPQYVVLKQQTEQEDLYCCLEFVMRSINVVQWKMGPSASSSNSVQCQNNMKLISSPLVYYHTDIWDENRMESWKYQICPLKGGFIVEWTNASGSSICMNAISPLKLENECSIGEGLILKQFYQYDKGCHWPLDDRINIPFMCYAFWNEGSYTFMIFVKRYGAHISGLIRYMRIPTNYENEVVNTAYIIKDGICDVTDDVTESKSFVKLTLTRHVVHGMCADETPACDKRSTLDCSTHNVAMSCRNKCGLCAINGDYRTQPFPAEYDGKWIKSMNPIADEIFEITKDGHIKIPFIGNFVNLGLSQCKGVYDLATVELGSGITKYTLLGIFDNGCSVRTVILDLQTRSSSVMSYKITQTSIKEVDLETDKETGQLYLDPSNSEKWCMNSKYKDDTQPGLKGLYHKNNIEYFNLVRKELPPSGVNCNISRLTKSRFHLNFPSGEKCNGDIYQNEDHLELTFDSCEFMRPSNQSLVGFDYVTYNIQCIANFKSPYLDILQTYIFTSSPQLESILGRQFLCWIFNGTTDGTVYLFDTGSCDIYTAGRVDWEGKWNLPIANISWPESTIISGVAPLTVWNLVSPRLLLVVYGFCAIILSQC